MANTKKTTKESHLEKKMNSQGGVTIRDKNGNELVWKNGKLVKK